MPMLILYWMYYQAESLQSYNKLIIDPGQQEEHNNLKKEYLSFSQPHIFKLDLKPRVIGAKVEDALVSLITVAENLGDIKEAPEYRRFLSKWAFAAKVALSLAKKWHRDLVC